MSRVTIMRAGCLMAALVTLAAACGDGEDRPRVDVVSGSGSGTGSGSGSGTGAPAEPGKVEPKPGDAPQVDVAMSEWAIVPRQTSVKAGRVYFLVENTGPDDPHEFVIVRTDLAPNRLPVKDGKVREDQVKIVDEIRPYLPKSTASITLKLQPGKYALICNIAEVENGELESHYELGMWAAFTVTD